MAELPLVELLDQRAQHGFREALIEHGFTLEAAMQPEALAAIVLVAEHPPKQRHIALAMTSSPARAELDAYLLIELVDDRGLHWTLTETGERVARILVNAVPARSEEQRREDVERLRALGAQAAEALRGRP